MTSQSTELLQKALALPADERAQIAERLLSSLDPSHNKEIEELWAKEAEDRLDAFDQGQINAVSREEVKVQTDKNA